MKLKIELLKWVRKIWLRWFSQPQSEFLYLPSFHFATVSILGECFSGVSQETLNDYIRRLQDLGYTTQVRQLQQKITNQTFKIDDHEDNLCESILENA